MIKEAIGTGDTVLEAQEAACKELGVETHEAEFEVIQMPEKKVFGLFGGCPAKVKASLPLSPIDVAEEYLVNILNGMGVEDYNMDIKDVDKGSEINIDGDDMGFVIGRRGETLDALQYLTGLVANNTHNSYYRITVNVGNYRQKREKTLEILGRKIAIKASRTGRKSHLEPMNPFERRIIHTSVQKINGATSWSEGENVKRHVVIGPDPNVKQDFKRERRSNNSDRRRPFNRNTNRPRPTNNKPENRKTNRKPLNEGGETGLYGRIDK